MAIDRTTIKMGPGKAAWDSVNMFSQEGISVSIAKDLFDVQTSAYGVVDRRVNDVTIDCSFTPKMWDNLAKILPYATLPIGSSIYGATDKPLVITPINGAPLTVVNAAITKLPSITLSANKPILGGLTFTGLLAKNSEWTAAAARMSLGSVASGVAIPGFDLTKIPNTRYSGAFGSLGFESEDGFQIDFDLQLEDVQTDSYGTVDKILSSLTATCKFVPVGISEAELLAALAIQGSGFERGSSIGGADLTITGAGVGAPIVTLHGASLQQGGYEYDRNKKRAGEVTFVTRRTLSSGALAALFTIDAVGA